MVPPEEVLWATPEERMRELIELSDGNPEILKIAARFEFSDEHSLADINTADDLVLRDLATLFDRSEGRREQYERLFVLLSMTGGLETRELVDLLDVSKNDLRTWAEPLRGYLSRDVAEPLRDRSKRLGDGAEWQISPDIYADATFRRSLDTEAVSDYDFRWAYGGLFDEDCKLSFDNHLFDIARNLGVAYDAAERGEDDVERQRCLDAANAFLRRAIADVEHARFVEALVALAGEGVPFELDVIEENADEIVEGAARVERFEADAGHVLQFVSGYLYGNHVVSGDEAPAVPALAERFAVECRGRYDYDPAQFLSNVYSMAVKKLADSYEPAEATEWLDTLEDRAWTAATDAPHGITAAQFLENVYSMAVSNLADSYDPEEATEWLDTILSSARWCSETGPHEETATVFLASLYAFAVGHVTPEHPDTRSAWHRSLLDRIIGEASAALVVEFYSRYHLALSQSHEIADWLSWLVEDALSRTVLSDDLVETDESALEVASSVLAEAALRLHSDPKFPRRLDTDTGWEVIRAVASLATTDVELFARLVSRTAEILGTERPNDWFVKRFDTEPSEWAAVEFVGHAYARAFVKVAQSNDDEFPEEFYERAVDAARATDDPSTCLVVFHSRALPWFSAGIDPEHAPEIHERLFERALETDEVDPGDLYTAYLGLLGRRGSHDPAWFAHLAVDATARLQTGAGFPADDAARLDVSIGAVANAIHRSDQATGMSGEIPASVIDAAERLESEEPELFEKFAEPVAERLEEEHDNLLAALEWRTALGLD